jgi:hypothetical protein
VKSRSKRKKRVGAGRTKNTTARPPLDPLRTGMPAIDSITGVDEFRKGKKVFQIIHTNEVDEYERAPSKPRRKSGDGKAR